MAVCLLRRGAIPAATEEAYRHAHGRLPHLDAGGRVAEYRQRLLCLRQCYGFPMTQWRKLLHQAARKRLNGRTPNLDVWPFSPFSLPKNCQEKPGSLGSENAKIAPLSMGGNSYGEGTIYIFLF